MVTVDLMSEHQCAGCGKSIPAEVNYCNFGCVIESAKRDGGEVIAPNGLPIACVRADGTMLEHEHADHVDYKFPVTAQYIGERVPLPEWDTSYENEVHALIYASTYIALTIYECCYSIWGLPNGVCLGGFTERKKWRLTAESIAKIADFAAHRCPDCGKDARIGHQGMG